MRDTSKGFITGLVIPAMYEKNRAQFERDRIAGQLFLGRLAKIAEAATQAGVLDAEAQAGTTNKTAIFAAAVERLRADIAKLPEHQLALLKSGKASYSEFGIISALPVDFGPALAELQTGKRDSSRSLTHGALIAVLSAALGALLTWLIQGSAA